MMKLKVDASHHKHENTDVAEKLSEAENSLLDYDRASEAREKTQIHWYTAVQHCNKALFTSSGIKKDLVLWE